MSIADPSTLRLLRRRLPLPAWLRRPSILLSAAILLIVVCCALFPSWLAPHDPFTQGLIRRLQGPLFTARNGDFFLLGTDQLGRDILSRIVHGTRVTLLISLSAVLVATVIGIPAGLIAGYAGGRTDAVVLRLIDMQLAFPVILLVIAVVGALGQSLPILVLVMGLSGWPSFARIVRAAVLTVRGLDFVDAARALGASPTRVVLAHILPNVMSAAIVFATFELSRMILIEATLSFLGLGVQPPTPSWGGIISDGQKYLTLSWAVSVFPGIAIAATILAINLIGDLLRDMLDPHLGDEP